MKTYHFVDKLDLSLFYELIKSTLKPGIKWSNCKELGFYPDTVFSNIVLNGDIHFVTFY